MSDVILSLIIGTALCTMIYFLIRWGCDSPPEKESIEEFDAMQIEDDVKLLYKAVQRLKDSNAWVIELQVCKPGEALRDFNTRFCDITGENREISIVADGDSETSRIMLELAEATRDEINLEVIERVNKMNAHITYLKENG